MIFRLSRKLATKIKTGPKICAPPDPNPFADWSAHLFTANRAQYIVITNTASLYRAHELPKYPNPPRSAKTGQKPAESGQNGPCPKIAPTQPTSWPSPPARRPPKRNSPLMAAGLAGSCGRGNSPCRLPGEQSLLSAAKDLARTGTSAKILRCAQQ